MLIRKMTIEDYERVHTLWLDTPGMGLNTTDDSREGIEKYLARNPNTCFVAESGRDIVGVILSGNDGRRGFIYHTAVKVSERGRGIGRLLVESAMTVLKAEGITKVALVAFSRNAVGNGFWEKLGFSSRDDLVYRNRNIVEVERVDA